MGENPTNPIQEAELDKALRSMGNRVDQDPIPEGEAKVEPEKKEDPVKEPEADPVKPEPKPEDVKEPIVEPKKVERPETYIPMPKYLAEKREWDKTQSDLAEANKKIEELTILSQQKEGAKKDEDIEEFMAKHGFDREVVEDLLKLTGSRNIKADDVMKPEEREAVAKATQIVKEAEIEAAFNVEFEDIGQPAIIKIFPDANPEQLAKAKEYLDKVSHTKANSDKDLDYLVFKHQEEIQEIIKAGESEKVPDPKRPMEASRIGNGKQVNLTADDFKDGKTDFNLLGEMDQAVRSEIVKNMDQKTYASYLQYAKGSDRGIEVMRNGQRVVLK